MDIYEHTIKHVDYEWTEYLSVYTTFMMNEDEFVEYFNNNLAGTSGEDIEARGATTNIYELVMHEWEVMPRLEYRLDRDEDDDYHLKFAGDDLEDYKFEVLKIKLIEEKEKHE